MPSRSITPASAWRPAKPSAASRERRRGPRARLGRGRERRAGRRVAGAQLHRAEREQRRHVVARAPVVLGRLLVGERGRGLLGGGERVGGGLGARGPRRSGRRARPGSRRPPPQRLADAPVQAHAAARALALVERLAHERVRVGEAVELVGLADQARLGAPPPARRARRSSTQRLEQRQVELAADDRRPRSAPGWRRRRAAARRREIISLTPSGTAIRLSARSSSSGSAAQRLLDEERVALGLLGQPAHELRADVARPTSARVSSAAETRSASICSNDGWRRSPAEQLAEVGGAGGAEHQQPGTERVVEQVASSSVVPVSAQCRSSRISTTGRCAAANVRWRTTPSKSRQRSCSSPGFSSWPRCRSALTNGWYGISDSGSERP